MKTKSLRVKDKLWVQHKGRIHAVPAVLKKGAAATTDDAIAELVAPFSCKVLKILVNAGQSVKKGDPVITVEAMKMEYSYASPRDGVIQKVLVTQGIIVQEGTRFVEWRKV